MHAFGKLCLNLRRVLSGPRTEATRGRAITSGTPKPEACVTERCTSCPNIRGFEV